MSPPKTELSLGLLGVSSDFSDYCPGPSPSSADTEIKPDLQNLIHDLILHIHEKEPDIEKSILVFLPTYYSLEQQWYQLEPFRSHLSRFTYCTQALTLSGL
ncbi:hypothetical protein Bca4012_028360 [Brassica carinata]